MIRFSITVPFLVRQPFLKHSPFCGQAAVSQPFSRHKRPAWGRAEGKESRHHKHSAIDTVPQGPDTHAVSGSMRKPCGTAASPAKLAERLGTAAGVARPVGRGRDPSCEEVGTRAQRRNIGDLSTGRHLRRGRRRRS